MRRAFSIVLAAALIGSLCWTPVEARRLLEQDAALRLAFGEQTVFEREAVFLTEEQRAEAERLSGGPVARSLVSRWVARSEGRRIGTAYFDTHRVRSLQETLLVAVDAEGRVTRVEVVSFQEPTEYLPRRGWFEQFDGRALDPQLDLDRGIHTITGATLSAVAATEATRRVLALHRVIEDGE